MRDDVAGPDGSGLSEGLGPLARLEKVYLESWKFEVRQAMIDYAAAVKRDDYPTILEVTATCSALVDRLAVAVDQARQEERERCFRIVMDAPNACVDEHDTEDTFNAMKAMAVSAAAKMRRA
jgi:hypothetical protein